jgi:hypothetical protein
LNREALQALFARAAARRAERRVFVETLRDVVRRATPEPLRLCKVDLRRTPRET